ncbi:MAG: hypothetical protein Q4C98_03725 [Capnocytophaga sp.]|nr:hypothetical protein [Capnocytophaga sp.]
MSKSKYNYLRIYANMGKKSYDDSEKATLVKSLVEIAERFCTPNELRYDITGAGYGISKGSPYCMAKTFWDKLNKKGYQNMEGISIVHQDEMSFRLYCMLILNESDDSRLDMDIFWENQGSYDSENALKIAHELHNILKINYAYGYIGDKNLRSSEWVNKQTWFSSTSYIPKEIKAWEEKISDIPKGAYRPLFDFNILNINQIEKITEPTTLFVKKPFANELEIWIKAK